MRVDSVALYLIYADLLLMFRLFPLVTIETCLLSACVTDRGNCLLLLHVE